MAHGTTPTTRNVHGSHLPRAPLSRTVVLACVTGVAIAALATGGLQAVAATPATTYTVGSPLVSDAFSRTTADGWGAAPVGGAYTLNTASSFSTGSGVGTMSLGAPGASLTASLASVKAADVTAAATIDIPKIPASGNGVYAGLLLRSAGGSYYRANIRVGASDVLTLTIVRVNGATQTTVGSEVGIVSGLKAGAAVQLQFQATGANPVHLQARAWVAGSAQPGWQLTADDSAAARLSGAGAIAAW